MAYYIARRLLWTLVVVAVVLLITFAVFYLLPAGDPALRFAGKSPSPELLREIRHRLGLDQAWYVQFGKFLKNFAFGDQYGWPGLWYSFWYATKSAIHKALRSLRSRTWSIVTSPNPANSPPASTASTSKPASAPSGKNSCPPTPPA